MRWFRGNLSDTDLHLGLWDECLELADGEIDDPEPHYIQVSCRTNRSLIRLARGETRAAVDDGRQAVEQAREIRDPQAMLPTLAAWAFCLAYAGDTAESAGGTRGAGNESRAGSRSTARPGPWVVHLAFALLELGRQAELLLDSRLGVRTPWRDAALAVGRDDLAGAADILHSTGSIALEAHARLRAAQRLAQSGEEAEAAAQLAQALAFYRGVGAVASVRIGEDLLPATG